MTKTTAWYARRYVERFGFHIVPIEPGRKFPRSNNWGNTAINDADAAERFYTENPNWNLGVALRPSRLCSLDIDCWDSFSTICECLGIDLDALMSITPTIKARGIRIMFRVPDGVALPYRKISWPSKNDPTKSKHKAAMDAANAAKQAGDTEREARIRAVARRWAMKCVFELRACGADGKQRQDVLPPSIHPDTGQPYRWQTQPVDAWPEPPAWLLAIWTQWDSFKGQILSMCPWLPVPETAPAPKRTAAPAVVFKGDGVIDAWLQSSSLTQCLERYGYRQISQRRWLSPHSSTGLPGVILFPDERSCWIHHASDPLCSEESGRPVNAFDLFCYYEHGGDIKRAVSSAADLLGIKTRSPISHDQASAPVHDSRDDEPGALVNAPPSRDYMSPLPWTNGNGKPLKHIDNLREILRRLGITVRYNVIAKDEEILIPGKSFSLDNAANASLAWLISECSMFSFPTDKLGDFITYLADQNLHNPVAQWVTSTPWDGVSRLPELFATVRAVGEQFDPERAWLKETLIKRWMVSAIAAAFSPKGVSAGGVLTFQGPQYIGKTKWFKSLVPPDLGVLKDGVLLRPDDKDSVKQAVSFWLVELGELDSTFRKSDIAQLKAFLTNDSDVLRRAYARRESHFARRTVFFGSVNPREFLNDPTGNRRYWTIECESLDHSHSIDMQQVWAEVYAMWQQGEPHHLTGDELDRLNASNEEFMAIDPIEERILSYLDWDSSEATWRWVQASEVLIECGLDRPTRHDAQSAATLLRKKNGGLHRRTKGKTQFWCPPKLYGV